MNTILCEIIIFLIPLLGLGYVVFRHSLSASSSRIFKAVALVSYSSLWLASLQPIAHFLLKPLEYRYPPLLHSPANLAQQPDLKFIVILGASPLEEPTLSITSQLGPTLLLRFMEGIRLHRELPQARLILSGGGSTPTAAHLMAVMAQTLGEKSEDLILEDKSETTSDEARLLASTLAGSSYILVTSARHMPRSVALFSRINPKLIPAPSDYLTPRAASFGWESVIPSPRYLLGTSQALYEYLGFVKAYLKGNL